MSGEKNVNSRPDASGCTQPGHRGVGLNPVVRKRGGGLVAHDGARRGNEAAEPSGPPRGVGLDGDGKPPDTEALVEKGVVP